MARHVIGFTAILSPALAFTLSVRVQAAQELIPPQNDPAKATSEAPAPPTATDAERARAAERLRSAAGTERQRATQRLLPKAAAPPPLAGVIHLNRLFCRDRQERGHDEVYLLVAGRRTPARGAFRIDDEGPERSVHKHDLFEQTLAPGEQSSARVEVWEDDGGGRRDDLIGSVRVTLVNVDGAIHASWEPAEFARALPATPLPSSPYQGSASGGTQRFELFGNDAHYEIELTAVATTPEPPQPVIAEPAAPAPGTRTMVETVVVPAPPPPGPSVRVVIPRRRPPCGRAAGTPPAAAAFTSAGNSQPQRLMWRAAKKAGLLDGKEARD